jgi:Flp pilus assembly protein TadG
MRNAMDQAAPAVPESEPDREHERAPSRARRRRFGVRRGRGERGAVLVEAAIILPVLLLIVLGIVEYSLAFKNSLSVTSATRAGARTASAQPRQANFSPNTASAVATALTAIDNTSPQVLWIYNANSAGMPDSGNFSTCNDCNRYTWNQSTKSWDLSYEGWFAAEQNACAGASANAVGIYIRAQHRFMTSLFGSARTLEDHTVMRLEPIPTSAQCAP